MCGAAVIFTMAFSAEESIRSQSSEITIIIHNNYTRELLLLS